MPIDLICLDADDTLWHHEAYFRLTHDRFSALLAPFASPAEIDAHMLGVETRNLALYGYGAKAFTLSMIETALAVSAAQVSVVVLADILAAGKELMAHPVETLPGAAEALERLAGMGRLVLITKGDLFHQESKLAASGLGAFFSGVEIVSEKAPETYRHIFKRYGAAPECAVMAGNSARSDILPVLEIGGHAALVPYPLVWAHEAALVPQDHPRFSELASLADLPEWIAALNGSAAA